MEVLVEVLAEALVEVLDSSRKSGTGGKVFRNLNGGEAPTGTFSLSVTGFKGNWSHG